MTDLSLPTSLELQKGLQDNTIIVTGGSRGIGLAIAQLCVANGATVVIADVIDTVGLKAASELGNNTLFMKCDVTSWSDQLNLFSRAIEHSPNGRIDGVVCNAGIAPELILSRDADDVEMQSARQQVKFNYLADELDGDNQLRCPDSAIVDINLNGVIYGVKLAEHYLRKSGRGGRIVVLGSAASYLGLTPQDIYCASKHAVLGLVRATSARQELVENDIAIGLVAPWYTKTDMTSTVSASLTEGRLASSAADIAAAVGLLLVGDRGDVNGKAIWVQGQTYTEVEELIMKTSVGLIKHAQ